MGISVKSIKNLSPVSVKSIKNLSPVELREVLDEYVAKGDYAGVRRFARPLIDAMNKRLKRLEKGGYASASKAYQSVKTDYSVVNGKRVSLASKKGGLKVSYAPKVKLGKVKNAELLRDKVMKAYDFMFQKRDSSIARVKSKYAEVEKELGLSFKTKNQAKKFWDAFHKFQDSFGGREQYKAVYGYSALSVQDAFEVWQKNKNKKIDTIVGKMAMMYEANTKNETGGLSAEEIAQSAQALELSRMENTDEAFGELTDGYFDMGDSKDWL